MRRLLVMVLAVALVLTGCAAPRNAQPAPLASPGPITPQASPKAQEANATLNLYFPDNRAEKLDRKSVV